MRKSKADRMRGHALRRFRERYGISLNEQEYLNIVKSIQDGKARKIDAQSQRVGVWEIDVRGEKVEVCYDSSRHELITCLPSRDGWLRQNGGF